MLLQIITSEDVVSQTNIIKGTHVKTRMGLNGPNRAEQRLTHRKVGDGHLQLIRGVWIKEHFLKLSCGP